MFHPYSLALHFYVWQVLKVFPLLTFVSGSSHDEVRTQQIVNRDHKKEM